MRQLNEDLKQEEMAMVRAAVSVPSGAELDNAALLGKLRGLPGVTAVQGNANYPIAWKLPGDEKFRDGYVRAFSEPFGEVPLEPTRLTTQGRYPLPGHKEVAIERRMAKKYGLAVGDELVLRTLGGTSVREETWTIVGVVYHAYTFFNDAGFLSNDVSVYANYADAQHIAGFTGFSSVYASYTDFATAERALEMLDLVGVIETAHQYPSQISGGQQQRAAIARALVNDPQLIVGDEPTGNLDTVSAGLVFALFEDLVAQGKTIIMVTHDWELAGRMPRVEEVRDGLLVGSG